MKTKERALVVARRLLNTQGVKTITLRHIAQEMGISHGNLGYHFPTLSDIIFALYRQLVGELNAVIGSLRGDDLAAVHAGSWRTFELLYAYRFLLLDFVEICRSVPGLRDHYRLLQQRRQEELSGVIGRLVEAGILRTDIGEEQYRKLIHAMTILGDFWLSSGEMLYQGQEEDKVAWYFDLFFSQIVPYLTPIGRAAYASLPDVRTL
ncbi:MAG: hypothetical protein OHK0039_30670 [Bacteroidia bacterium]